MITFIVGAVVGFLAGILAGAFGVIAGVLQDEATNHNGYELEARLRGDI